MSKSSARFLANAVDKIDRFPAAMSQTSSLAVLHLITELDVGGSQRALYELVRRLDARFRAEVVCFYGGEGLFARRLRDAGVPVTALGEGARGVRAVSALHSFLRRDPSVLLHSWLFHPVLASRLVGRRAGVEVIVGSRRSTELGSAWPWRELLLRWTWRREDHLIAVSTAARDAELLKTGRPSSSVTVIANGIDPAGHRPDDGAARDRGRRRWQLPDRAPLLAAAGRLHRAKGFDLAIEALAGLTAAYPRARLALAGGGAEERALRRLAEARGVADRVLFLGVVEDLRELLAAADVWLVPSRWEGLPNVLLEALAASRPVVASAVGGIPEVVSDGIDAALVPAEDPAALSAAVRSLLDDPEAAMKMASAGRARVEESFSLDRTVAAVEDLYDRLLGRAGWRHDPDLGWRRS